MNSLSKRLKVLASFIDNEDSLVDVGCDHGYLSIYLKKNNKCKNVICSDINQNALDSAISNIRNSELDINCYLSDGLKNVPMDNINTIVIAGMGTSSIISILSVSEKLKLVDKIVLQSNNNHEELRRFMNSIGYYLVQEKYVLDKGKWYITMLYVKDKKENTELVLKYGYIDSNYGRYLINNYSKIIKRIPKYKEEYEKYIKIIKEIETILR